MGMNLIIDIGNSRVKIAVFNKSELIHTEIFTSELFLKSVLKVIENYTCLYGIISSVVNLNLEDIAVLKTKIHLIELNSNTKVPFINNYGTPKTLGVDRIAVITAAVKQFPSKNVLVIDAGTCITFDFVSNKAVYYGGAISPGILMRYKALHEFTNKLPLLTPIYPENIIGNSTEKSIHSGVVNGVIKEIDGVIDEYRKKNQDLTIVLTGGDVNFLANKLKNSIFANPIFLLEGLNTILTYNL
jgi:type III pantothenate kinase